MTVGARQLGVTIRLENNLRSELPRPYKKMPPFKSVGGTPPKPPVSEFRITERSMQKSNGERTSGRSEIR